MRLSIRNATQRILIIGVTVFTVMACEQDEELGMMQNQDGLALEQELEVLSNLVDDDPEGATAKADELIKLGEQSGNHFVAGKAKYYLAYMYDDVIQDISQAYYYYNEALKDLSKTDRSLDIKKALNNLGLLYHFYGQYDAAIANYTQALELAPDLSDKHLSNLYYNMGVSLKVKGDQDSFFEAEEAFTKALEIARQIEDHENIADVNNQIGMMYKDVQEYEMARIAYKNNIRSYQNDENMRDLVGRSYHGIGVTYMDEGNIEEAIRAFEQALVYETRSTSKFATKYDLGTVLMRGNHEKEAVEIWKDALQEKHNRSDIEQVQIYSRLSEALASNGNFEEAVNYALIFNTNVNRIVEEEKTYIAKNDKVLFQDIVKEYDEFNSPQPFYANFKIMLGLFLLSAGLVYLLAALYYRSRASKKVSQTMSRLNSEFQHIKVE